MRNLDKEQVEFGPGIGKKDVLFFSLFLGIIGIMYTFIFSFQFLPIILCVVSFPRPLHARVKD